MLLCAATTTLAQTPADFYASLFTRGASYVEAGQYDAAVTPLRIAAFGLVDNVASYQSALAYLAIAQEKTGNADGARDSVRRIISAERIERRFGSLQLPVATRNTFLEIARKYLPGADANALASGGAITTAAPKTGPTVKTTQPQPTPTRPPQTTTPAPVQQQQQQAPQQQPPQQQTTQTQQPPAQSKPATSTKPADPKATVPQTSSSTRPAVKAPTTPAPQPQQTAQTKPAVSAKDVAMRITAAERALTNAQLAEAQRLYRSVLDTPNLDRDSLLRVVEGLYRARDFSGALTAFKSIGTLKAGEEPYGYYQAVAFYETGQFEQAKKVLATTIPYIEMTPDVARYRAKIEAGK